MSEKYNLIVIGGGPAGYVAAIRASQLGLKVACIEKNSSMGGTCLNVGCIPSKTLLHSSYLYELASKNFDTFGIKINGDIEVDIKKMMSSKNKIVSQLTSGVSHLLKKYKVNKIEGSATIKNSKEIVVNGDKYITENILIATGSIPSQLADVAVDEEFIVSSTGAINFNEIPDTLVVIGGGYIGLELGSVWNRLGSKVIVIEYLDKIVPSMDKGIADILFKALKKQGLIFNLNTKVVNTSIIKNKVDITCELVNTKEKTNINADKVLLAIGRKPYTDGLGINKLNIVQNKNGTIKVDKNFSTNIKGIYAIGDVIDGPMLAHKASSEGHAVAEIISGKGAFINYNAIPAVIYTDPEVAWVGSTEEELKEKNIKYNVGSFPLSANARAKTTGESTGLIKILVHSLTLKILGVHIIGPHAGELIGEAVLAIETGLTGEDLALICQAHPTLSESFKEAASLASSNYAIHY